MDPSDPRHRRRQPAVEGPTSSLAAPWRRRSTSPSGTTSPWGRHWACTPPRRRPPRLRIQIRPPLLRIRPGALPPTSAAASLPQERVPCAAAEDLRGDARPLRHRGRRAATPPIDVNAGLQRCRRPPLPVLSNAPPRACFPSSLSAALLSARSRLRGRPLGVVGLLHGRSRGAAQVFPDSLSGLRRPAVRLRSIVDPPEG